MMKVSILILAVALVLLQLTALAGLLDLPNGGVEAITVALALGVGYLAVRLLKVGGTGPSKGAPVTKRAEARQASAEPVVRAEGEIVAFLALLQAEGRLVDFAQELIDDASDAQVGAAARLVHAGCRKVLREYLELGPVRAEPEGAKIVLKSGFDPSLYRLIGKVSDHPPYTGRLVHPGWAVRRVKLPRVLGVSSENPWPVLAPAEVEVEDPA